MLVAVSFIMALLPGFSVFGTGIDQATLNFNAHNNIFFYDPTAGCGTKVAAPVLGKNVTWIGDSYSVAAELRGLISGKLPGVDLGDYSDGNQPADSYIKESKGVSYDAGSDNPGGITILENIVAAGKLRPYLVFALGANNGITDDDVNKVLNEAGSDTDIVFVTQYMTTDNANTQAYIRSSNEVLEKAEKNHSNVRVADWASVAKDEYYATDSSGVHPYGGLEEWVGVIYNALLSFNKGTNGTNIVYNENYAGDMVWTDEQLAAIKNNQAIYEKAEKEYGVPWQAIATMHSLETGLARYNPDNGQGIYQLYSYTDGGTNANAFLPAGPVDEAEFERQTMIATQQMKAMIESRGLSVSSDEGIKALLFAYNGTASQYIDKALALGFSQAEANIGEGSPYVMNRYDARRDPNSDKMDPAWPGRYVADGVYDASAVQYDFGGFVKYIALVGSSDNGTVCVEENAGGSMDLNAAAIELAWPEAEQQKSFSEPKPEYVNAMKSTGIWAEADTNNDGIWDTAPRRMGMSCDMFVGTVVRYSGVDPTFPYYLGGEKDYLANSDLWEELYINDSSQYKAGDIRIEYDGGHITMVVEIDGELKIASASAFERFGDIGSFYPNGNLTYRLRQ